jgi:hypothetical protein
MPKSLIDDKGNVQVGVFPEPVDTVNYRDFALRSPMGGRASSLAQWLGFNQFEFLGVLSEEIVFGVAIANVRYAGTGFAYVHEPATRRRTERSVTRPLGLGFDFVQTPERGTSRLNTAALKVEMEGIPGGGRRLMARAKGIEIDARYTEGPMEPLRICTGAGATGWVFTRKTAGHSVEGTLVWEGKTYDLAKVGALGHHDWSAGYMRRETFWNWGCLAGRLGDGRVVGLNASCGVNETSFLESCFWVDGVLHRLPAVHFAYDREDFHAPWKLTDERGRIDLTFVPEGSHKERINAGLVASNFIQIFGRYTGTLTTEAGERLQLDGLPGYSEWHYAKW